MKPNFRETPNASRLVKLDRRKDRRTDKQQNRDYLVFLISLGDQLKIKLIRFVYLKFSCIFYSDFPDIYLNSRKN